MPEVPPLPLGKSRCRARTREYWRALHEDERFDRLPSLDKHYLEHYVLELVEMSARTDVPRLRVKAIGMIHQTLRDFGMLEPLPPSPPPSRERRAHADSRAVLES